MHLIRFDLGDDGTIVAEVDDPESGIDRASEAGYRLKLATASPGPVRALATTAVRQLSDAEPPDEIGLEFGIPLNMTAGAVLARSSVDGDIQVRLAWKRREAEPTSAS